MSVGFEDIVKARANNITNDEEMVEKLRTLFDETKRQRDELLEACKEFMACLSSLEITTTLLQAAELQEKTGTLQQAIANAKA